MIPDKQADIVLYCGGGYRSALAAGESAAHGLYARGLDDRRHEVLARGRLSHGSMTTCPPPISSTAAFTPHGLLCTHEHGVN